MSFWGILFLSISAISFIAALGIHAQMSAAMKRNFGIDMPSSKNVIPNLSAFVLAVIPETLLFNIAWYWMFLINIPIVFIGCPIITSIFLKRFSSGQGADVDLVGSIMVAVITLIIGIFTR